MSEFSGVFARPEMDKNTIPYPGICGPPKSSSEEITRDDVERLAGAIRKAGWDLYGLTAVARRGGTLSGLAKAITGNGEDWKLLGFKGDPGKLKIGDEVNIRALIEKALNKGKQPDAMNSGEIAQAELESLAEADAARYGVPPGILKGLVRQESRWKVAAKSPVGAVGLTQLMPATARELGLRVDASVDERLDPAKNIDAGARYLRAQYEKLYEGKNERERWRFALAAYNGGRGRVNGGLRKIGKLGKAGTAEWSEIAPEAPGETRDYVRVILGESGEASGYAKEYGYGE